jgi:hypothetical protein
MKCPSVRSMLFKLINQSYVINLQVLEYVGEIDHCGSRIESEQIRHNGEKADTRGWS